MEKVVQLTLFKSSNFVSFQPRPPKISFDANPFRMRMSTLRMQTQLHRSPLISSPLNFRLQTKRNYVDWNQISPKKEQQPQPQPQKQPLKTQTTTQTEYWTPTLKEKSPSETQITDSHTNNQVTQGQQQSVWSGIEAPIGDERLTREVVDSDAGLQSYLKRVMFITAGGLLATTVAAVGTLALIPAAMFKGVMITGAIGSIGSAIGLGFTQPTYKKDHKTGQVVAENSMARKMLAGTLFATSGMTIAPMLGIASAVAPMAIPVAACATVATMAGMGAYALSKPRGSLLTWGAPLMIATFGLIGVSIVGMLTGWSGLAMVSTLGGIGIFAAWTAFDLHQAVEQYKQGQPDELGSATGFYLNFINLFTRFLQIFMMFFRND